VHSPQAQAHTTPQTTKRIGYRLPERPRRSHLIWHNHGLSIVLVALFVGTFVGQALTGWFAYNADQRAHHQATVALAGYLHTGHFVEATFENFESEFLQMAFYVVLTALLYQRGSSESKRPGVIELVDLDPRESPNKVAAPWPVRRGGIALRLYEHSLSLTFGLLFVVSFALHAAGGVVEYNAEQMAHNQQVVSTLRYVRTSQFWFESFQNWQSEFLSLAAMVVLTIFLRQRGSAESKPVDAPTWETGT
jgi:glycerol uptake facilitator-like aquaporin